MRAMRDIFSSKSILFFFFLFFLYDFFTLNFPTLCKRSMVMKRRQAKNRKRKIDFQYTLSIVAKTHEDDNIWRAYCLLCYSYIQIFFSFKAKQLKTIDPCRKRSFSILLMKIAYNSWDYFRQCIPATFCFKRFSFFVLLPSHPIATESS